MTSAPSTTAQSSDVRPDLPTVTIVVPAYNEAEIIEATLRELHAYLQTQRDAFVGDVLVVNDGSSDGTGELAERFASEHDGVRVIHHRTNFNLGQALRYAFGHCRGDYVVTIDCDLSYSVDHIGKLVAALQRTHAKIALASPYADGGSVRNVPWLRRSLSRWANRYLAVGVKGEVSTLTGMVRGYDRVFLQSLDLMSMDVAINTEIIYKARILGARITEIPAVLDWRTTVGRVSKAKLAESIRIYVLSGFLFRPLLTLCLPGFVFLAAALLTFIATISPWLLGRHGLIDTIDGAPGTVIITAIFVVVALQFFSLGLLAWQSKRNFENLFHLGTTNLRRAGTPRWADDRES